MNGPHVLGCLSWRDDPDTGYPYDCDCDGGEITTPTARQQRRMHILWREAHVTDRDTRLYLTGLFVRRRITSSTELQPHEAERLIHFMTGLRDSGQFADKATQLQKAAAS